MQVAVLEPDEMTELKQLSIKDLEDLFKKVRDMRILFLDLVQEYGFDVNKLVSQTFERQIEAEYGHKLMEQVTKGGSRGGFT